MSHIDKGQCRGCGAPVLWRFTPAGARMPLNPDPLEEGVPGSYALDGEHKCRPFLRGPYIQAGPFYLNHWATCPNFALFKRKGKLDVNA